MAVLRSVSDGDTRFNQSEVKPMCETKVSDRRVECGNCGIVLPDDRPELGSRPCPECGSDLLHISLHLGDRLTVRDRLECKVKDSNYKLKRRRFIRELRVGSEPQRGHPGKWANAYRDIDRVRNTYDKIVVDEETGQVLHECHEPLSSHRNRGSAKRRPPEDKAGTATEGDTERSRLQTGGSVPPATSGCDQTRSV